MTKLSLNAFSVQFGINRKVIPRLLRKDYLRAEIKGTRTFIDMAYFYESVNKYNSHRPLDDSLTPEQWLQEASKKNPQPPDAPGKRGGWNKGNLLHPRKESKQRNELEVQMESEFKKMHEESTEVLTPLQEAYLLYCEAYLCDAPRKETNRLQLEYFALSYHNKPLKELTKDELIDIKERQRICQLPLKEWAKVITDTYGDQRFGKDMLSLSEAAML